MSGLDELARLRATGPNCIFVKKLAVRQSVTGEHAGSRRADAFLGLSADTSAAQLSKYLGLPHVKWDRVVEHPDGREWKSVLRDESYGIVMPETDELERQQLRLELLHVQPSWL